MALDNDILLLISDVCWQLPFQTTMPDVALKRSNGLNCVRENRLGDSIMCNSPDEKEGVFTITLSVSKSLRRTFVAIEVRMPSQLGSTKVHDCRPGNE